MYVCMCLCAGVCVYVCNMLTLNLCFCPDITIYAYTCVADRLPHIIREHHIILSVSVPRSRRLMEIGDANCVKGRGQTY